MENQQYLFFAVLVDGQSGLNSDYQFLDANIHLFI